MKSNITLEEALRRASRPLARKIEYSVNLLRKAEKLALAYDPTDGFYLAFSGGKDSQALYHIAELAGVKFKAHMSLTTVDPPEVIRFVRTSYPDVEMIKPQASIYEMAKRNGIMPTRKMRWCCAKFKENAGAGKVTLIGIRHEESYRRAKRNEVEISLQKYSGDLDGLNDYRKAYFDKHKPKGINITNATEERTIGCIHGKESILISSIIEWTVKDVWEFIKSVVRVPYCCLYDEGNTRIGCLCCPMSQPRQKNMEIKRYPHVKRNWIKAIQCMIDNKWDKENQILKSAEDYFDWWISGKSQKRWYADKYIQRHFDFEQDEQGDNSH